MDDRLAEGEVENAPRDTSKRASGLTMRRIAPVAVIAALFVVAWLSGLFEYFTLSSLIRNRAALEEFVAANFLPALAGYFLIYVALVAISFPGASLLTIAAGLVFGGIVGGLVTVVAATAGACVIFLIARSSMGDFLHDKAGPFVARMIDGFNRDGFNYLLTIRLTPIFPFWVVNIVPALLNMRLGPFALATFLGIIPGTFAYAYVGAGFASVIAAQEAANPGCAQAGTCQIDPASLVTTEIIIAMVGLAAISLIPVIVKRLRGRKPSA